MANTSYDHPNFLVIRERALSGTISGAGLESAYVGSSLKVAQKAVVTGVVLRIGSGGSAAGSCSLRINRVGTGGTQSIMQTHTFACSAGASAAGDVLDITLVAGFTITSIGEAAAIACSAASLDKIPVLSDVIWKYRVLQGNMPTQAQMG